VVKPCTAGQATDVSTTHAHCLLDKRLQTQSEYVILFAFPLPQWLQERACVLRYSELPAFLNSSYKYVFYFSEKIYNCK